MKIVIIDVVANFGGGQRFTKELVSALAAFNQLHEIILITRVDLLKSEWLKDVHSLPIQIKGIITDRTLKNWFPDGKIGNLPGSWQAKILLRDLFARVFSVEGQIIQYLKDTDLVYFPWMPHHLAIAASFSNLFPVVVTIHDLHWHYDLSIPLEKKQQSDTQIAQWLAISKGVVTITESLRQEIWQKFSCGNLPIQAIQQAVPGLSEPLAEPFKSQRLKELGIAQPFILFPSGIWPHKNHANLLRAIKILKDRGVKISLVCTGKYTDTAFQTYKKNNVSDRLVHELQLLVNELGLESDVDVFGLGNIDGPTLSTLYEEAQAVIVPSFAEGCSFPLLEGAFFNKPVICSDIPAHREMTTFYHISPFFCWPHDPFSIADAIHKNITEQIVDNFASQLLLQRNWRSVAEQYLLFFQKISGDAKPSDRKHYAK